MKNGMAMNFSWDEQIRHYTRLYAELSGARG
jgi:hypothetical protein